MNWLTNFVRPKLRALVGKPTEIPGNLWVKCSSCGAMVFHREMEANHRVCTHCGYHLRLGAKRRLDLLLDADYRLVELPSVPLDPLKFRDSKRYSDRLKEAQSKTGEADALLVGSGTMAGMAAIVAAFDFDFMGGSMGAAVGEGLLRAAELAVSRRAALIVVSASGGARMQEGILSLMQMPRTTIAVAMVREARLPYIVVLSDPTTGGVSASFAMLGDVTIAEPGAVIGFAGARVIEETLREKLPDGFQRSEYLLDHGMIDCIVRRHEMKETLARILSVLTGAPAGAALPGQSPPGQTPSGQLIPAAAGL